jgi:excisionase family DNA binding protein
MSALQQASSPLVSIPPILKPSDACSLAKIGKASIYAAIKSGSLPSFKRGRSRFIPGPAFQQWLADGMPDTEEEHA